VDASDLFEVEDGSRQALSGGGVGAEFGKVAIEASEDDVNSLERGFGSPDLMESGGCFSEVFPFGFESGSASCAMSSGFVRSPFSGRHWLQLGVCRAFASRVGCGYPQNRPGAS